MEDLLELMGIDLAIDKLLDNRSSLPALEEYKRAHGEVERLTAELEVAHVAAKDADRNLNRTNGDLEIKVEKAAAEQNRLYAGGISARDADYLRREVEMLYQKVSKMEDEVLEYLEAKENAESDTAKLSEELNEATRVRDALSSDIKEKWSLIDKELALKKDRKKSMIELVDEYLLEIYDKLRNTRSGRVVGRLSDGTCGACHLSISAAEVSSAMRQYPPRCIHCSAIMVV